MDDKRIVELYWERSEEAIKETESKYGAYCHSIAYGILNNKEDAEESVNDTYLDAWNSMPPHKPSLLSTFLGKITRRISIDKYRRRTADKRGGGEIPIVLEELDECVASEENLQEEIEKQLLADIINSFVKSLPSVEQKVFLCRYWYMDSIDSICKQFGFSESKVKSMLYRSREKLKRKLIREGFQ